MKTKFYLILLFSILFVAAIHSADVSDTWANLTKRIAGNFHDAGSSDLRAETMSMISDSIAGRAYKDMWLVPGTKFQYKFILDRNNNGTDTNWEPSIFSTTSTNREITIPLTDTTVICNWCDTPAAPTNLTYYADTGKIILSWNYGGEQNLDVYFGGGFDVHYCTGPTFDTWVKSNIAPIHAPTGTTISTLSYTITGLKNDSSYYITVRAFDAYTDTTGPKYSPFADSITAIPGNLVKYVFRFFAGTINPTAIYVGYDTSFNNSVWYEHQLNREGSTNWYSDTIEINAGLTFTYKIIMDTTAYSGKKYEFDNTARKYMFIYPATAGVSKVEVKGGWNSWGTPTSLTLNEDGYWRGEIGPYSGQYEYKFILNGTNYVVDPYNTETRNGNSLLKLNATVNYDNRRQVTVPTTVVYIDTINWNGTPYTPCEFQALSFSQTAIKLLWENTNLQIDIDTYYIEYSETPSDSTSWLMLAELDGSINSYIHNNLVYGDKYYYRIWAKDNNGVMTDWKNYSSVTLSLPVDVYFKVNK